jgi:hypothetical protein
MILSLINMIRNILSDSSYYYSLSHFNMSLYHISLMNSRNLSFHNIISVRDVDIRNFCLQKIREGFLQSGNYRSESFINSLPSFSTHNLLCFKLDLDRLAFSNMVDTNAWISVIFGDTVIHSGNTTTPVELLLYPTIDEFREMRLCILSLDDEQYSESEFESEFDFQSESEFEIE